MGSRFCHDRGDSAILIWLIVVEVSKPAMHGKEGDLALRVENLSMKVCICRT